MVKLKIKNSLFFAGRNDSVHLSLIVTYLNGQTDDFYLRIQWVYCHMHNKEGCFPVQWNSSSAVHVQQNNRY